MSHPRTPMMSALWWFGVLISGTVQAQHFEYKEHHLGPTGLFGVTSPTDIKITKVEQGSPADGKLKVGDVIVAAGGLPFKDNTRPLLAAAIDQAETDKAKGVLTVTLKDGGYSYRGLSDAGSHLLNYCLARHKLFITGRDADRSIWLNGRDASDTIALATLNIKSMSDDGLLAFFGHPLPKVRGEAIWELRSRQHQLIGSIKKLLKEGTALQRQSAIGYFGYDCPKDQLAQVHDELVSIMRNPKENIAVRADAASSLCGLGEAAYPYFNDLLKLVMDSKPDDKLGRIDEQLGTAISTLCKDPYAPDC